MREWSVYDASIETGYPESVIETGYVVVEIEGSYGYKIAVIQRIVALEGTNLQRFATDAEAGEQAALDGMYLFTSDKYELRGYYILDVPEYRNLENNLAWGS